MEMEVLFIKIYRFQIIPDQDSSGFGTLWVSITGIKNGAPDGLAY